LDWGYKEEEVFLMIPDLEAKYWGRLGNEALVAFETNHSSRSG
jgi:hypothetical protein